MITKLLIKKLLILISIMLVFVFVTACGSGKVTTEKTPASTETVKQPADNTVKPTRKPTNRTLSIGTLPVGSSYNAVGNGLASVISKNSEVRVSVKPFAGFPAFGPLMDKGEVDLGVASAPDVAWGYKGENGYTPMKNIRQLVRGNYIASSGIVVAAKSGINSVADLKGKKVTSEYPGSVTAKLTLDAVFEVNGLTWNDVIKVPVPSVTGGIEALRDRRVDAAYSLTPTTPIMLEAHNAIGLKAVSFFDGFTPATIKDIPQAKIDKMNSIIPGTRVTVVEPLGYITEPIVGYEFPAMMIASAQLDNDTVYTMMETLWASYQQLHPIHVWLKTWTTENMFDPTPTVPYHPGSVQFFKDKGLWNDAVEKIQQDLLK